MMMLALLLIPVLAIACVGGLADTSDAIREVSSDHLSLLSGTSLTAAAVVGIISALAWGLGYFGQPHIIVRFMAMRRPRSATTARRVGISWMIISLVGAVACGIVGVAYFQSSTSDLGNPELVVLAMAQDLMHPFLVGLVFAAVLAAIMSTVSSQLIVSSSAFVEDLYKAIRPGTSERTLMMLGRLCVLVVAIIASLLAINPGGTILELVAFAWAGFGASFGPAILLCLFWRKLTNWGALSGMITGAATVFLWSSYGPEVFGATLYEIVPGFAVNLLFAVVISKLTYQPNEEMEQEFDSAVELATSKDEATA